MRSLGLLNVKLRILDFLANMAIVSQMMKHNIYGNMLSVIRGNTTFSKSKNFIQQTIRKCSSSHYSRTQKEITEFVTKELKKVKINDWNYYPILYFILQTVTFY